MCKNETGETASLQFRFEMRAIKLFNIRNHQNCQPTYYSDLDTDWTD